MRELEGVVTAVEDKADGYIFFLYMYVSLVSLKGPREVKPSSVGAKEEFNLTLL